MLKNIVIPGAVRICSHITSPKSTRPGKAQDNVSILCWHQAVRNQKKKYLRRFLLLETGLYSAFLKFGTPNHTPQQMVSLLFIMWHATKKERRWVYFTHHTAAANRNFPAEVCALHLPVSTASHCAGAAVHGSPPEAPSRDTSKALGVPDAALHD